MAARWRYGIGNEFAAQAVGEEIRQRQIFRRRRKQAENVQLLRVCAPCRARRVSRSQEKVEEHWERKIQHGTSLAVQWLRLRVSNAGGEVLIPGWGTKIPHARGGQKKKKQHEWDN